LDNDSAGHKAARKIKTELANKHKHVHVSINPPRGGKDYNEALLKYIDLERNQCPGLKRESGDFLL